MKSKIHTGLTVFTIVLACFYWAPATAEASANQDPHQNDPSLVAAHQYATNMLENSVPAGSEFLVNIYKIDKSVWECLVIVTDKNGHGKAERMIDKTSPERACTQAMLLMYKTQGL